MRILLATDRSTSSEAAIDFLEHLNFTDPIDFEAMSCVPVAASVGFSGLPPVVQSVMHEEEQAFQEHLDAICKRFGERAASVTSRLVIGPPAYEITQEAEKEKADLVVLGAVGKSMMERVVLGSVSDFVATHAPCSVLIVRPPKPDIPAMSPPRIMVALDGSEDDQKLLAFLRNFQWSEEAELHLVHVMEDFTLYRQDLIEHMDEHWQAERKASHDHLKKLTDQIHDVVPNAHHTVVIDSHIGEALVRYADRHHCDLVVMGDHKRGFFNRLLLGSVSRYLTRYAHCSVAITRT
ncbi:MAG: universal stress protein [Pirellulaceae bacterium]